MLKNMRWGFWWGVGLATAYSMFVTILAIARGSSYNQTYHLSLGAIVAAYYAGGVGAGLVVGALRPLTKWSLGAMAVGSVAALPVAMAVGAAMSGDPRHWGANDWTLIRFFCVFLGPVSGLMFWWRNRDPRYW